MRALWLIGLLACSQTSTDTPTCGTDGPADLMCATGELEPSSGSCRVDVADGFVQEERTCQDYVDATDADLDLARQDCQADQPSAECCACWWSPSDTCDPCE